MLPSCKGWVTVSQELNNNGGELIQAEIAKLRYIFENALKYSSRVNPLKNSIFLCLLFEFSLSLAATSFQCIYENC